MGRECFFMGFNEHYLQKTFVWQFPFSDKIENITNWHYLTVNMYGVTSQTNKTKTTNGDTLHNVRKQTNNTFNLTAWKDRYHQELLAAHGKNIPWEVLFSKKLILHCFSFNNPWLGRRAGGTTKYSVDIMVNTKSHIRETPTHWTDAYSRTDTICEKLHEKKGCVIFLICFLFFQGV